MSDHFKVEPVAGGIMLAIAKTFTPQEAIRIGTDLIGAAYMSLGLSGAANLAAMAAPMGMENEPPAGADDPPPASMTGAGVDDAPKRRGRPKRSADDAGTQPGSEPATVEPPPTMAEPTADPVNETTEPVNISVRSVNEPAPVVNAAPDPAPESETQADELLAKIYKTLAAGLPEGYTVQPSLDKILQYEFSGNKLDRLSVPGLEKVLRLVSDARYIAFRFKPVAPELPTTEQTAALDSALANVPADEVDPFAAVAP